MMVLKKLPDRSLTPAAILATVPKPPAIARAEAELATLRQIRDSLADMAAAAANLDAQHRQGLPPSPEARQIAADQVANAAGLDKARRKLADASAAYITNLKRVIAPQRTAALEALRNAYGETLDAWRRLDEIDEEMRKTAPGSAKRRTNAEQFRLICLRLIGDRLAEEK
jgi:hypothetical protein